MAAFCHACRRPIHQGVDQLGIEGDYAYHAMCLEGFVRTHGLAEARRMNPTPLEQDQKAVIAALKTELSQSTLRVTELQIEVRGLKNRNDTLATSLERLRTEVATATTEVQQGRVRVNEFARANQRLEIRAGRLPSNERIAARPAEESEVGDVPHEDGERFELLELD